MGEDTDIRRKRLRDKVWDVAIEKTVEVIIMAVGAIVLFALWKSGAIDTEVLKLRGELVNEHNETVQREAQIRADQQKALQAVLEDFKAELKTEIAKLQAALPLVPSIPALPGPSAPVNTPAFRPFTQAAPNSPGIDPSQAPLDYIQKNAKKF